MKDIGHDQLEAASHKDLAVRRDAQIQKIAMCKSQVAYFNRLLESSISVLDRHTGDGIFRFMQRRFTQESKYFLDYIEQQITTGNSTLKKLNAELAAIEDAIEKLDS